MAVDKSLILNRIKLIVIAFCASLGSMYQYGYSTTILLTAKKPITEYLNQSYDAHHDYYLNEDKFDLIWQLVFHSYPLGFIIGLLLCPFCVEKTGRKPLLLFTAGFDVVATVLQAVAFPLQIPALFAVGRFILGVGSGLSCIALTLYLQESSPTKVRGVISTVQASSIKYLALFGMLVALPTGLGNLDGLPYLMCVGALSLFWRSWLLLCPDSPKFLLLNKRDEIAASKAIIFYQGKEAHVEEILNEIRREGVSYDDFNDETLSLTSPYSKIIHGLKQPQFIRAVALGGITFIAFNFAGFVVFSEYFSKILTDQFPYLSHTFIVITSSVFRIFSSFASIVAMISVERHSRRKLLVLGHCLVIILLVLLCISFIISRHTNSQVLGYLATVIILIHTFIFSVYPATMAWYITGELVPQPLRSTALMFSQIFNICSRYIVSYSFLPIYDALHEYTFLLLFVLPTALCATYLYFKLPETRNREVADIVKDLQSDKKNAIPVYNTEKF